MDGDRLVREVEALGDGMAERCRRGRRPKHIDAADRQRAYRERKADEAARAWRLKVQTERPTVAFVRQLAARLVEQSDDPRQAMTAVMEAIGEAFERATAR